MAVRPHGPAISSSASSSASVSVHSTLQGQPGSQNLDVTHLSLCTRISTFFHPERFHKLFKTRFFSLTWGDPRSLFCTAPCVTGRPPPFLYETDGRTVLSVTCCSSVDPRRRVGLPRRGTQDERATLKCPCSIPCLSPFYAAGFPCIDGSTFRMVDYPPLWYKSIRCLIETIFQNTFHLSLVFPRLAICGTIVSCHAR